MTIDQLIKVKSLEIIILEINQNQNPNRNGQNLQGTRDNNSNNNQSNNGQNRQNTQAHPKRQTVVCTYTLCGLKGHKEEDYKHKADDLQKIAFKDLIIESIQTVVSKMVDDHLKVLGFPSGPGTGS